MRRHRKPWPSTGRGCGVPLLRGARGVRREARPSQPTATRVAATRLWWRRWSSTRGRRARATLLEPAGVPRLRAHRGRRRDRRHVAAEALPRRGDALRTQVDVRRGTVQGGLLHGGRACNVAASEARCAELGGEPASRLDGVVLRRVRPLPTPTPGRVRRRPRRTLLRLRLPAAVLPRAAAARSQSASRCPAGARRSSATRSTTRRRPARTSSVACARDRAAASRSPALAIDADVRARRGLRAPLDSGRIPREEGSPA